jgi:hypothetical protein
VLEDDFEAFKEKSKQKLTEKEKELEAVINKPPTTKSDESNAGK